MTNIKFSQVLATIKHYIKESSQAIFRLVFSGSSGLVELVKRRWRMCVNALAVRSARYGRLVLLRWRHLKSGLESLYLASLGAIAPWVFKLKNRVPPMNEEQKRTIIINGRSLLSTLPQYACSIDENFSLLQGIYLDFVSGNYASLLSIETIPKTLTLVILSVQILVPICKMLVAYFDYLRIIKNQIK